MRSERHVKPITGGWVVRQEVYQRIFRMTDDGVKELSAECPIEPADFKGCEGCFAYLVVQVRYARGTEQREELTATLDEIMGKRCPDDGTCHHDCTDMGCWRVFNAGPLSNYFPKDAWPAGVRRRERMKSELVRIKAGRQLDAALVAAQQSRDLMIAAENRGG